MSKSRWEYMEEHFCMFFFWKKIYGLLKIFIFPWNFESFVIFLNFQIFDNIGFIWKCSFENPKIPISDLG